jgi:hypothetical protein
MEPGAVFFAEDFYEASHLTAEEQSVLEDDVAAHNLFDLLTYKRTLTNAGLIVERVDELSQEWTAYTGERVRRWLEQKEELVRVHRADTYSHLLDFYSKVQELSKEVVSVVFDS